MVVLKGKNRLSWAENNFNGLKMGCFMLLSQY